ncbi:major capsid protein [Paenirhodobacter populi]|uniref:Major capsid protein n=1 Tax=Paenirhodobacter populi TaxID=2306993 RepID=A0A443J1E4_9RHOB|nr:major capsid protein [Sinirhodobacter populi]RWR14250.1 hypothetical protein D2T33_03260 [Sinirhodobacter populi]
MSLNNRTAAVIDPILSTYARGYRNSELIGHVLFPRATIPNRNMRVVRFGKESFRMLNTRRAPGADKKRIQYGYASDPVSLVQDALEGTVPIEHMEEADKVPGIDLGKGAVDMVLEKLDLGLEYDTAQIARADANYGANNKVTMTGADRWSDPSSDPEDDVKNGNEAIRRSVGRRGNTLVLGPSAFLGLTKNAKIKEQFKYTSADSITTAMLAAYFRLKTVIVGEAVYLPENATENTPALDVWGDDAILAYVPQGTNYQVPAYAYTYELSGYPQVAQPYFEARSDSWVYPTKTERRPVLVGAEGGFLFKNAGAA